MSRHSRQREAEGADAAGLVDQVLGRAAGDRASDVHIEPDATGYAVRYRIDGLLNTAERLEASAGRAVVNRLMVLAGLLTYKQDVPQEGRIEWAGGTEISDLKSQSGDRKPQDAGRKSPRAEFRLSIMPTTHGLRAAVRLPGELTQPRALEALGLPEHVEAGLRRFAASDAGLVLLTGPAGSGKTTTIYALLEHITATQPGVSVVALEDPVERDLPGVTQIEVRPFGELTYERALRSMLRQDPQVLMIGEVRDAATASLVVQAALSGHRMISTLHAGSVAGAIARLLEMKVEPYQINSALTGVVNMRLVRRVAGSDSDTGTPPHLTSPQGGGTGRPCLGEGLGEGALRYIGRLPIAEFAVMDEQLRGLVAKFPGAERVGAALGARDDYLTLGDVGQQAIERGWTDRAEIERVLGAAP